MLHYVSNIEIWTRRCCSACIMCFLSWNMSNVFIVTKASNNLCYPLSWNNIFSGISKSLLPIPPTIVPLPFPAIIRSREDWSGNSVGKHENNAAFHYCQYVEAWLLCIHLASVRSFKCHPSLRRTLIQSNGTVSVNPCQP